MFLEAVMSFFLIFRYEIDGEQFDAVYIECKIDAGFHYFIKGVNGDRIEKNGNF